MCKHSKDGGVRCLPHCPEARAEKRASEKVWNGLTELSGKGSAFMRDEMPAKSLAAAEHFLSRWYAHIQQVMLDFQKARMDRTAKRAALRETRQEVDRDFNEQARLTENERAEKGEKRWGQEAVDRAKESSDAVEVAVQKVEDAEEDLLDAEEDLLCTLPGEFVLSPYQAVQFQCALARVDYEDAQDLYEEARKKQKPADMKPDPKTGLPSRKQRELMRLRKNMEATKRMSDAWQTRLEKTMTQAEAEAARDTAAANLELAKAELEELKKKRHDARCAIRPSCASDLELAA